MTISQCKKEYLMNDSEKERYFLASIVDSSQDSVVTIDFDSVITSWNKAAEVLYGYPAVEAIGKKLSLVVLPADIAELFKSVDTIKNNGEVEIYETVRVHKGGSLIDLEVRLSPVKDSSNRVIGVSTVARNMTDRRRAEEALKKSQMRFSAIVNQATVGIYETDSKGKIVFVNRKLCELLGYDERDLIGKSIWDVTHPDEVESQKEMFTKMITDNVHFEAEKRLIRKDASIIWVNETITPIVNEANQRESSIGILSDVMARRQLAELKDDFIGVASHELRTPLTSLKAYGDILEDRFGKSDFNGSLELIKRLNRQIDRLKDLVNELLDTTRVAEGRLVLQKEMFDLNDLVTESMDAFGQLSNNHNVIFQAGKIRTVCADRTRMEEVVNNLVSNAIKYSPDGGNVFVGTSEVNGGVKVSVADEGVGIPKESLNKVFDRFFRVTSNSHGSDGLGLGLYITAGIIRSHGGEIGVQSEPGKGTVFYFTLPYTDRSE